MPICWPKFRLGEAELVHELPVAARGLNRVQVLALDVLNEGDGQGFFIGQGADDGGDAGQASLAGGPEAALAGDQFVAPPAARADHDRLQDAVRPDAGGQVGNGGLVEDGARLVGVGDDVRQSDLPDAFIGGTRGLSRPRFRRAPEKGRRGRWRGGG